MKKTLFKAHLGDRRLVVVIIGALLLGLLFWSCSDERNEPPTAPDPGYTQTITLLNMAQSDGNTVTAPFSVDGNLAPISQPGQDQPARLYVWAFIDPDNDIFWREAIIADSIPDWEDTMTGYQQIIFAADDDVDRYGALIDSCEAHPESCSADSLSALEAALATAQDTLDFYSDLFAIAQADTTRLGMTRDSLAVVLDDRYTLSIQFDGDPLEAYPGAIYADEDMTLSGQSIHTVNTVNGLKGKEFQLDLARFNAADPNNVGRPIEINWTTCFAGSDRPCMAAGNHSFTFRVNGPNTWVSAVLVLVYAEER